MELHEILASLPRGKADKPLCMPTGELVFDPWNIDGPYGHLDPEASGCIVLMFSKAMDPAFAGKAFLDGVALPKCVLRSMPQMGGLWVVGIGLRGFATEFGRRYILHVEGFRDTDGNERIFPLRCLPWKRPGQNTPPMRKLLFGQHGKASCC